MRETHSDRNERRCPTSWWVDAPREMTDYVRREHLSRMTARGVSYFNDMAGSSALSKLRQPGQITRDPI
jgi:hypothetical protein